MRASSEPNQTLQFDEARRIVIERVRSLPNRLNEEHIGLEDAHGRVLAESIAADRDYPALRRSLRDGFAVRSIDVPGTLQTRGELRAGDETLTRLAPAEAIEIMTGAPVPDGADAVIMIEHVTREGDRIRVDRQAEPGQFINGRAAEARQGAELIPRGKRIDASHIALLAMAGYTSIPVFGRPSVAILATGDEIVALGEQPAPHQVRNSNSYMLATLVERTGGRATILPIARDTREALEPLLEKGLQHDMLIVSGGVSAGKYDLVKPVLRQLGTEFHFERVRIQPGQPTAFGSCGGKPVFGLPGNPGSSLITFQLFSSAAIEVLGGNANPILPQLSARFSAPFRHRLGLTRFLPAKLNPDGLHLEHIPWQGSSDIPALARANVFLIADHDRESWDIGDPIRVLAKL